VIRKWLTNVGVGIECIGIGQDAMLQKVSAHIPVSDEKLKSQEGWAALCPLVVLSGGCSSREGARRAWQWQWSSFVPGK
jgi:hypothetical protein